MSVPILLGIDPGYDRLGWAVGSVHLHRLHITEYGTIVTDRTATIFSRFQEILIKLQAVLTTHQPNELAIETLFFSNNKTTAMRVSETRGLIIGQCLSAGLSIHEYNPTQIKQTATGSGKADKRMMAKMIALQTNITVRDTLDDAVDAVAVLLTHSLLRNSSQL